MFLTIWVPSSPPCRLARGHPSSSCPAFWLTQWQEFRSTKSEVQKEEGARGGDHGASEISGTCQQG